MIAADRTMRRARFFLAALALAAALPAAAQEQPELVYAKYHRAAIAGDVDEMMRWASEERRAELGALSPAQRSAEAKMAEATMPRGFIIRAKAVNPDGQAARLYLSGQGTDMIVDKLETLYGTARLVLQRGRWRVAGVEWTNQDPGLPPQAAPGKPAAKPAPQAAAPASRAGAPIGSLEGAPVRKLGTQKPPCVYKPVMTEEDLDNCR